MKQNYDLKGIMRDAWRIYKETDQGDGIKPVFGMCLQMAWVNAKADPVRVVSEWQSMTEAAQIKMLQANVRKAAKNEIAYSIEDHYNQYNETVAWFMGYHGLDGLVNEAWLKLAERLDPDYLRNLNAKRRAAGKCNISLVSLVYRCAKDAIRATFDQDIKHGRARVHTVIDKNGDQVDYIDTMATSPKDNTETKAIIRATMSKALEGLDDIDRIIIEGRRDGYSEREIADIIGTISAVAVHKRIVKIREKLSAAGLGAVKVA